MVLDVVGSNPTSRPNKSGSGSALRLYANNGGINQQLTLYAVIGFHAAVLLQNPLVPTEATSAGAAKNARLSNDTNDGGDGKELRDFQKHE